MGRGTLGGGGGGLRKGKGKVPTRVTVGEGRREGKRGMRSEGRREWRVEVWAKR